MGTLPPTPKSGNAKAPHFAWLEAIADNHLAGLSAPELRTLLVYARHANRHTLAGFPGPARIAKKIGSNVRAAKKAIASLTAKGFLRTVGPAGGRGNVAVRALNIPAKTVSGRDTVSEPQTVSKTCKKQCPKRARNSVQNVQETVSQEDTRTVFEHSLEHLSNSREKNAAADGFHSEEEDGEKAKTKARIQEAFDQLEKNGIGEPKRSSLLKIPGITADIIHEVKSGLSKKAGPGLLVTALEHQVPEIIERMQQEKEYAENAERDREQEKLERRNKVKKAIHEAVASCTDADTARAAEFNGELIRLATTRLEAVTGIKLASVGIDVATIDGKAIAVFAIAQQRAVEEEIEWRQKLKADVAARREKSEAEMKARQDERKAEEQAREAKLLAERKMWNDFRGTYTDAQWKAQVAAMSERWPAYATAICTSESSVKRAIFEAVTSGKLERVK